MALVLSVILIFSVFCTTACAEDNGDVTETITENYNETKTYKECLDEIRYTTRFMICGVAAIPAAVSTISIATPLLVFLPVSLPVSAVAGIGASLAGIINILFVPLEALIMYMNQ